MKKAKEFVFRNLEAEQARMGLNNEMVAEKLGVTRQAYEAKKKRGRFSTSEIKTLCLLFSCSFDYLFYSDDETEE